MNTLMAGAKSASASRGKYSTAGYLAQERDMYISREPAGSAQDRLRDMNQPAYRADVRAESPEPALGRVERNRKQTIRSHTKKKNLVERIGLAAETDRAGAIVCVVLICIAVGLGILNLQKHGEYRQLKSEITRYTNAINALEAENAIYEDKLAIESSGEKIRNRAQNELGMLRPERAARETIYITIPNNQGMTPVQEDSEPELDLMDIVLGIMNVMKIGE